MHVETMSRSLIGMSLPLDQPNSSPNTHTFPPFPSPESECIPSWLQFDSLANPTHYSSSYGTPVAVPIENTNNSYSCTVSTGESMLELERAPCADSWEDQQKPLPSFPLSLGKAKRRAMDLACITRASPTGLHRPYSPAGATTSQCYSPPPYSGCYGHLAANNVCWAEQISDNQVVVSQNEGLCMLVESQESYARNEDYGNTVVMDILADNHQQQQYSVIDNYPCQVNEAGYESRLIDEENDCKRLEELDGRVGKGVEQWEETEEEEEEEELEEEAVADEEEEEEEEKSFGGEFEKSNDWKREKRRRSRRRRKQDNESDGETDSTILAAEDDNECSLPSTPTALICRWSDCNSIFGDQSALVRHIEKTHVDARSRGGGSGGSAGRGCSNNSNQGSGGSGLGEEFACHWHMCPRRTRPFNARYKLLIHMRVHSGDKPNKCPYEGCPKAFSRLENLKIHQRSHTGERPYTCQFPLCPKAFSNSSDRAKHQRTHFDTKPYACQVAGCSKRYTDPSSLRKHVKNHSPKDQTQARKKAKNVEPINPSQGKETKCIPYIPSEISYIPANVYQDYNSEISSSATSVKENAGENEELLKVEKMEDISSHRQETEDGYYTKSDITGLSSQDTEDDLFFDCFQSLESIRPLLNGDKDGVLTNDLQNAAQFELSLDLDCAEVQQDFLEIGVLEKWGVTGANIVGYTTVDGSLDGDFLTIS